LNEQIDQLNSLIDDHRSPVFSTIKDAWTFIENVDNPTPGVKLADDMEIIDRLNSTIKELEKVNEYADQVDE